MLAKKEPLSFHAVPDECKGQVLRHIPGLEVISTTPAVREYLDTRIDSTLLVPDRVLEKWGRLFDIVTPSSRRTCCFTRGYTQLVERAGSILQENEILDTATVFDSFLEAQSRGESHVEVLHPLKLRYFSPSELLRIFAVDLPTLQPSTSLFKWPDMVSVKSRYRLIGNSVNVKVVEELIRYIFKDE